MSSTLGQQARDLPTPNIHDQALRARLLADSLFRGPACHEVERKQVRCLQREKHRPLKAQEKRFGWVVRPFSAYDPNGMCPACRCYWWAEMLAQELAQLEGEKDEEERPLPQKG